MQNVVEKFLHQYFTFVQNKILYEWCVFHDFLSKLQDTFISIQRTV